MYLSDFTRHGNKGALGSNYLPQHGSL